MTYFYVNIAAKFLSSAFSYRMQNLSRGFCSNRHLGDTWLGINYCIAKLHSWDSIQLHFGPNVFVHQNPTFLANW